MAFHDIFLIFCIISTSLCSRALANTCEASGNHVECPGSNDPPDYSKCCMQENSTDIFCCLNPMHEHNDRLVMLVSITVITSCLALSVMIVVCCFWSRCPLFYSCRVNYAQRGIIAYSKEEEALNQPPDENEYCHQYTPVNVKICKVNDI